MGRKLTSDEINNIQQYAHAHADLNLGPVRSVIVTPELDDEGKTHFKTLYALPPKNWIVLS